MKKKLFSFVMATLIIFMSMPTFIVPAQAATTAGGFVYEIIDGEVTITDYTGRAMELVIPAEIEGYPVTAIGKMAFYSCSSIYEITVPDTVTSIGDSAFEACYNLVEAYIPKSVKAIGDYVFSGTDLVSIYYTGSKEDWKSIDPGNFDVARVFYNYFCTTKDFVCSLNEDSEISVDKYLGSATVVNVPREIEGYPVTRIGDRVFDGCNELTSVNIPSTVTSIGNTAFGNCEKLASIDIPESVTEIDYGAFYACRSLTFVEIPAGVSLINAKTFAQCTDLKKIIIPDSVNAIGFEAFYLCADIVTIDIPDTVTSIGKSAFDNCHSLQSITIPNGVESIEPRTFNSCYALQSVVIPESVKIVGDYAFTDCMVLSTVNYLGTKDQWEDISISAKGNVPLTNAEIIFLGNEEAPENIYEGLVYEIIDGEVTITAYTGSAAELTVPAEIEGCPVTSIGDYSFRNCTSLTSINLPDSVTNIGEWAFMVCSSLTSITLPDSVTSIGDWAFVWCDSLANINIPQCVTCINVGTFSTCRSLTSVTIPVGVLSISDCAFDECTGIRAVYYEGSIEQWNAISFGSSNGFLRGAEIIYLGEPEPEPLPEGFAYEIVDGEATVLYYVGNPVELTVPAEYEGYPVTSIGSSAFACHEDLISITLPDTVTSIGEGAFLRCFSLESINIPEGVTSIGEYAFLSCSSLENINIPDGVTSICEGAFSNCSSLTSITIPNSLKSVGEYAFNECNNLKTVYYGGTEEEWKTLNISGLGEGVTVRFITEETPDDDIDGDGEENKTYDLSELFTNYEEKSIYEMVEFIDSNQESQRWVEFIRADLSDNNTYMIYLHMSGELTNSLGSVPDLSIAGITDSRAKYLLSTAQVTNTDPDNLPGNIMIGDMGDKLMTVEINKEFIEHINSLSRLDGNVMILDLLMNILENEEVVGVSFSVNDQMYTNTSSTTFNLNSDSTAYEVCVIGDCNGDGIVNGIDGNIMKRILSGSYCKADPFAVDLHDDGILNAKDCLELKRIIVQG